MIRAGLFGVAAMALLPGFALAQPPQEPASPQVQAVTVTGANPEVRTSIDRSSYDITKDLNATAGSVADVLQNLPSVQVDLQGNVSVRGDRNVVIMIDGKPAPELRGPAGAAALQMLPAGRFDRVELSTNPSAANSPEGSAIINLVSRQGRGEGRSWQARGSLSDRGQYGAGVYGTYNGDKLALNGDAGFRRRKTDWTIREDRRVVDPMTGAQSDSLARIRSGDLTDGLNASAGAAYDPSARVKLTGAVRYAKTPVEGLIFRDESEAGRTLQRVAPWFNDARTLGASVGYLRTLNGEDHTLAIDLRRDRTRQQGGDRSTFTGVAASGYEQVDRASQVSSDGLQAEYKRPLPNGAALTAGAQFDGDDSAFLYTTRRGPTAAAAVVDPASTGAFDYGQSVAAAYATYETKLGKATWLAGLRIEDVRLNLRERVSGFANAPDYTELYPSAHLEYPLSDAVKLKASYSRRVVRPGPESLNPARFLNGNLIYEQGNPLLQPIFGNAYETALEYRRGQSLYRATVYLRRGQGMIVPVYTPLPGGGLLITPQNMARHQVSGLEATANGKLTPKLGYSLSGNLTHRKVDATNAGFGEFDAAWFSGRGAVNWQMTPKDTLQIAGGYTGKLALPQGYDEPSRYLNVGYRRKVSDRVFAVVTASDLFESLGDRTVIDTPQLRSVLDQKGRTRVVTLGLTYAIGAQNTPAAFDF